MKRSLRYLTLFFMLLSVDANAIIIITKAEIPTGSSRIEISYTSSGGNSNASIPCGASYCGFGIWVRSSVDTSAVRYTLHSGQGGVPPTNTWANANIAFATFHSPSGTFSAIRPLGSPPYTVCVGGAQSAIGYLYQNQPGTSCLTVYQPPVPTSCSFSGSPIIDHKTLLADQVNGKEDSVSININCNRATSATIASLGGTINLGGGVTSTLTFNGLSSGRISLPSGTSTHRLTSTLKATNPTPGDKSGSGTIVINLL